jgi:lysophospholipase L1-like esterase
MTAAWLARHRSALVSPYEELTAGTRFTDRTLRQVLHLHRGGTTFRLHISNRYGLTPLDIGELRLGQGLTGDSVGVTVGGSDSVIVGPGESVVTDPAELPVAREMAVSMYVRSGPPATFHSMALQDSYVAPGNVAAAERLPEAVVTGSLYFIEGVDVFETPGDPVVVAFGDSLTDGHGTTHGADQRYPDQLARRLGAPVLNVGISGNRLLCAGYGDSGMDRFQRDVLDVPGVTHVIIALGVNDIGLATAYGEPQPTAGQIISGLTTLADQARAAGVVPVGATLPPNQDTTYVNFHTTKGEHIRQAVNDWIRVNEAYAAVLDIDAALRDPNRPARCRADLDSGDGLHPNDSGAAAMAQAMDLSVLRS